MELYTPYAPDGLPYIYFKKSSNIFKFKVKAKLSTHIALATHPDSTKPYIEFVIEHFSNANDHTSFLRTRGSGTFSNRAMVSTYGLLNENEYRGFWISFADGKYACGREGEVTPFIEWNNPDHYDIKYIGVFSYLCEALWKFDDNNPECKTSGTSGIHTPKEEPSTNRGCRNRQYEVL